MLPDTKIVIGAMVFLLVVSLVTMIYLVVHNDNDEEDNNDDITTNRDKLFNVVRFFPDNHWEITKEDQNVVSGTGNQQKLNSIFTEMSTAEFSTKRYALAFMPGTYNLTFEVGYYTAVFGLGDKPEDVVINGSINIPNNSDPCIGALDNFWRSLENLHLNISPSGAETEFFSASQAAPIRRLKVTGGTFNLAKNQKGCNDDPGSGGFSSGGFMADTTVDGDIGLVTQQQFFWQNSDYKKSSGGAWNFLTVGCEGTYADQSKVNSCEQNTKPLFTTIATTPYIASKPYFVFQDNQYKIRVPAFVQDSSTANGLQTSGELVDDFTIVKPEDTVDLLNKFLDKGTSLVFPPGIYKFDKTLLVTTNNVVVIGLGYATIQSTNGNACITVADDLEGVRICSFLFEAGTTLSPSLVQVGSDAQKPATNPKNPHLLQDIFCRTVEDTSKCVTMVEINSAATIVQHTWLWRADHNDSTGQGLGVDKAMSDHGIVVNGNDVTIYGLFTEHHLKENALWSGSNGKLYFMQSEWMYEAGAVVPNWDYPSLRVTGENFFATNVAAYSFFANKWGATDTKPTITNGFVTPEDAVVESALTVFLNADSGNGIVKHVINGKGQETNISNADKISLCGQNGSSCASQCNVSIEKN